jgi:cytochrome c oxidase assembly protein subunit 11
MKQTLENKNVRLAITLTVIAVAMFGFGYALSPIYDALCRAGIIQQTRPDDIKPIAINGLYKVDESRAITVEFMTTLNEKTDMVFRAETQKITIHPGEYRTVNFYAENKTDKVMIARATADFSPDVVKNYFEKTECFCFSKQTFKPHEVKVMPMRFVINPELPAQHKTITLAYTFFDITDKSVKE